MGNGDWQVKYSTYMFKYSLFKYSRGSTVLGMLESDWSRLESDQADNYTGGKKQPPQAACLKLQGASNTTRGHKTKGITALIAWGTLTTAVTTDTDTDNVTTLTESLH